MVVLCSWNVVRRMHEIAYGLDFCSSVSLTSSYKFITKDCITPEVTFYEYQGFRHVRSENAVSSKPESFGYQSPMLMVLGNISSDQYVSTGKALSVDFQAKSGRIEVEPR
ncbi:hypothetical protein Tco_1038579 [Tanacetum coccineum]